jgi:hypothetical protein
MVKMCTILTAQNRRECLRPVVEGSEVSVCAMHLILAATIAKEIGIPQLATMVRAEAA